MAVNSTDVSALEDAIKRKLDASLNVTNGGYVPDRSILIYNGEMSLGNASLDEFAKLGSPCIVIAVEDIATDQLTMEGGRHPRTWWATVDVGIYVYDETLRGTRSEATRGLSGEDRSPGVWKLINDVAALLVGEDLTTALSVSLKWEGPTLTGQRKVAAEHGKQLWRCGYEYQGAIEYSIDTSGYDDLDLLHGDLNRTDQTTPFDPDLEVETVP